MLMIIRDKRFINCALDNALEGLGSIFHHSFEVIIKRSFSQKRTQTCFSVHHTILEESPEEDMQKWAKDQKYTPWVAVAAQIPVRSSLPDSFCALSYETLCIVLGELPWIALHRLTPTYTNQPTCLHSRSIRSFSRSSLLLLSRPSLCEVERLASPWSNCSSMGQNASPYSSPSPHSVNL